MCKFCSIKIFPQSITGLLVLPTILLILMVSQLKAQHDNKIVVDVIQKKAPASESAESYINGFRKVVNGQLLAYHSSHPDADVALIARARRDMQSVSWLSDTLVSNSNDSYYKLLWLAGIEREGLEPQGIPRPFKLFINNEHWFTFQNLKDSSAFEWIRHGRNGASLSFKSDMVDRFGDLFGRMVLKIPKQHFPAGEPLNISIEGEDSESGVWYMTFAYSFNFTPSLRVEPAVLLSGLQGSNLIRMSLDNLCGDCLVRIEDALGNLVSTDLKIGANIFQLPINIVEKETGLDLVFKKNGQTIQRQHVKIKPVAERDIYILPYSHNDIGYTDLQKNVERKQWQNLDQALALIEKTREFPQGSQFKWNIEVTWPLQTYLEQKSPDKQKVVIEEIRRGNICLNALFANMLTGLMSDIEMLHMTEFARDFSRKYSVPIATAVVSDIPGFTWGIVTALALSGVKYFSLAPNSGDRVGHIYEGLGDKPFYWVSQSGEEKVLTWLTAAGYSTFHEGELSRLGEEKIMKMVRRLDEGGYPYSIVQLPYTIGGDNGPPDSTLPEFVMKWNQKYRTPHLRIATHAEMFADFEHQYGKTLPELAGDITPYWEDGAASSAYETALNRAAVNRLIQGEILWSMVSPENYPVNEYSKAWRNVLFYDEHTWGAHNSISDPDSPFVTSQWNAKRQFALDADSLSKFLQSMAVGKYNQSGTNPSVIDVYNTSSWTRSDIVVLSDEMSKAGDIIADEKGIITPSQRLSTGELAFYAKNIFPFSVSRYIIKKGNQLSGGSATVSVNTLKNDFLSVSVDTSTGVIESIKWKEKELVDQSKSYGVNRYLYVPGKDPLLAQSLSNVKVKIKEKGGILASLVVEGDAPGCSRYTSEIRIYDGIDRIDIINTLVKNPVRQKEGVHFAFPFNVPDGEIRYDVAYGIVKPEKDQLPGSCKNYLSVRSFIDISNTEYGVTLVPVDAPLIEVGAINAEKPWMKSIEPSQCVYSYVMNNYWHTNYRAEQEGKVTFRYTMYPHALFNSGDVIRKSREMIQPLQVFPEKSPRPLNGSMLNVHSDQVLVSSIKPVDEKSWIVQLYNPTSQKLETGISWNSFNPAVISVSSIFGEKGAALNGLIGIPAFATRFVRIDRK